MRRFSILLSAVVVMLLGLGIYWGSGTTAQEASPEAASGVIPPLLTQWAEAWSSGDPEQVVALYAPDAVYEEVPTNSDLQGHDEIRTFVEDTHATTSDIQVTPRRGFQAEDWAVLEGDFTGRSAEGVAFSVPFIVVMELDGDLIRRSADYFDVNSILTQIGAGTGTPAAAAEDAVAVSLTEFAIDMPTELAAGPVTFQVTNDGTTDHNFEVEGQGIEEELPQNLAPGQSGTLSLDLAAGTYEVYCPVDDHAAHGMRLELTVTG